MQKATHKEHYGSLFTNLRRHSTWSHLTTKTSKASQPCQGLFKTLDRAIFSPPTLSFVEFSMIVIHKVENINQLRHHRIIRPNRRGDHYWHQHADYPVHFESKRTIWFKCIDDKTWEKDWYHWVSVWKGYLLRPTCIVVRQTLYDRMRPRKYGSMLPTIQKIKK